MCPVTGSPAGHEAAKRLDQLIQNWPDLQKIVKALQPDYVFVSRYLRTIPRSPDDSHYRTDAYVNGLYVVDVKALRAKRHPQIDQDYLIQWRDNRRPEVSYFSGIPRRFRQIRPEIWHDISEFCPEFGHNGQYRCPNLDHSYADETDPNLPQEPPWPEEFARAMSRARSLAAASK
jgi:hypothetical protein